MLASKWPAKAVSAAAICVIFVILAATPIMAGVGIHPSGRYYTDTNGNAKFLLGYYAWAAAPDGYFIDHPARYSVMMNQGSPYKINYIRIGLGGNRMTATTNPPSWDGSTQPVPFLFVNCGGTYKADMNQWDPVFWNGLKAQCDLAQQKGFIVHLTIFDGVGTRSNGGASYGYSNSDWNPANQCGTFYPNPDTNQNGQIDDPGEFYRVTEFNNGNPAPGTISYYEKLLIDKVRPSWRATTMFSTR
ncbi:MAG: hypothetical protein Q7T82_20930 [Armatimonadota bacterium]|nr:hypothetical protein [Armatimonadota bacterium]